MIFDSIENLKNYGDVFKEVAEFIVNNDLANLAVGKYEISDKAFVSIQEYMTKPQADTVCEVHKKYTDLQLILGGSERMLFATNTSNDPRFPFNEEKDVAHHTASQALECIVLPGWFCVYFPGEFHKPGLCITEPAAVRKALFKIGHN